MNIDARIDSDMQAFAAATSQRMAALADTQAMLERTRVRARPRRRPLVYAAVAAGAAVFVPLPYGLNPVWDATFQAADGRAVTLHLGARNAGEAQRHASLLARTVKSDVSLREHSELAWASVYALARTKLFQVDVELQGKSDAEAEADIRDQLAAQEWTPGDVRVRREAGNTTVEVDAVDGNGHHLVLKQRLDGEDPARVQLQPEAIDDTREPGMTDAQLRDKIVRQFEAKGLEAEVSVEGEQIRVRVKREPQK
jgi:hypothetical protein